MVGKDILRFHAVYWPAFLMAADLPPPQRVFAHGWWTNEGQKISKSLGNVIDPFTLMEEFGRDQTRYFLMREVPFGQDGDFSRERFRSVVNSELANNIGNLAQRTVSMIHKNCDGVVPRHDLVSVDQLDRELLFRGQITEDSTMDTVRKRYHECKFSEILQDIVSISSFSNEYIDRKAPWTQKKVDVNLMNATLYHLLESIRCIAIMLQPFMPEACAKMLIQCGIPEAEAGRGVPFSALMPEHAIIPGTKLPTPAPLFPRLP